MTLMQIFHKKLPWQSYFVRKNVEVLKLFKQFGIKNLSFLLLNVFLCKIFFMEESTWELF